MPQQPRPITGRPIPAVFGTALVVSLLTLGGCGGSGSGAGSVNLTAAKQAAEAKGLSRGNDPEKAARKKQGTAVRGQPVGKRATR